MENQTFQEQENSSQPSPPALLIDDDGLWRWADEVNLWRNPVVFLTTLKVVSLASLLPVLLMFILTWNDQGFLEALRIAALVAAGVLVMMIALLIVAYLVITLRNGGRYCVVFEMDHKHLKHIQMQKQYSKNQVLSFLTIIAGLTAGNPAAAGAGLLSGSRQSSTTQFSKVKKIIAHPKRRVIYLNESLNHNQVYAPPELFPKILEHLISRCPKAKIISR